MHQDTPPELGDGVQEYLRVIRTSQEDDLRVKFSTFQQN